MYSDTYREISDQYRFTSSQATGKNDAWSSAHCGLRRVSPIASTPAASLATRRPCSRTENVNPQQRQLQVNTLLKDVTNRPITSTFLTNTESHSDSDGFVVQSQTAVDGKCVQSITAVRRGHSRQPGLTVIVNHVFSRCRH
jgi:hypothetical protein